VKSLTREAALGGVENMFAPGALGFEIKLWHKG
jgi:hypothetical protein